MRLQNGPVWQSEGMVKKLAGDFLEDPMEAMKNMSTIYLDTVAGSHFKAIYKLGKYTTIAAVEIHNDLNNGMPFFDAVKKAVKKNGPECLIDIGISALGDWIMKAPKGISLTPSNNGVLGPINKYGVVTEAVEVLPTKGMSDAVNGYIREK